MHKLARIEATQDSMRRFDERGRLAVELWRDGDTVYKRVPKDSSSKYPLDEVWRTRFSRIRQQVSLPAFVEFIEDGYATRYLPGSDLWGDAPFQYTHNQPVNRLILKPAHRAEVRALFAASLEAGLKTGWFLADFTRRNLILSDGHVYAIDFDVVADYDLVSRVYRPVWQNMLTYLGISCAPDAKIEEISAALTTQEKWGTLMP